MVSRPDRLIITPCRSCQNPEQLVRTALGLNDFEHQLLDFEEDLERHSGVIEHLRKTTKDNANLLPPALVAQVDQCIAGATELQLNGTGNNGRISLLASLVLLPDAIRSVDCSAANVCKTACPRLTAAKAFIDNL